MISSSTPQIRLLTSIIGIFLSSQFLAGLTNSDVITLHEAGIGADTILVAVNSAEEQDFDVSINSLLNLKEAGVDEEVIQAMLLAAGEPQAEHATEEELSQSLAEDINASPVPIEDITGEQENTQSPVTMEALLADEEPTDKPEPDIPPKESRKTPPKPLYRPAPVYPQEFKAQGISGSVSVRFTVNTEGNVQDINVINSDHDLFSAAATEALAKWKFNPGLEDGEPIDSVVKMSIPFNTRGEMLAALNRAPRPLANPQPNYPRTLRKEGVDGNVTVQVVVNADGDVEDVKVLGSDHELFTTEALKVLKKWKFDPALQDGQPISSRVKFSIPFKIRD